MLPRGAVITWTASAGATSYTISRDGTVVYTHPNGAAGATTITYNDGQGGTFSYTMAAYNAGGVTQSTSNPVVWTTITAPATPTNLVASAGNTTAPLTWTPPTQTGGSPIRQYQIVSYIGGVAQASQQVNAPASSYTFTGLTNGQVYTFRIACDNEVYFYQSNFSADSNAVTPTSGAATVPVAPTIGTASAPVAGQATVTFTPIPSTPTTLDFRITSTPGNIQATVAGSPGVITGLVNGTSYTFKVEARNSQGYSLPSAASNAVTPPYQAIAPGAPTIGTATGGAPGTGTTSVSFTAPAYNGGPPPTSYTVTSSPGGLTATGAGSPLVVTGLSGGTPYTFTVTATNANGTGPASAASNLVTLVTAPAAPIIGTATPGNASISTTFIPPNNGGSPITSYTATATPGGLTATGPASPLNITGLTNGTPYTVKIKATNAIGTGPESAASNSATPAAGGGTNMRVTATADDRVTVSGDQRVLA